VEHPRHLAARVETGADEVDPDRVECPAHVRGVGLLIAAELDEGIEAGPVANACLEAGLVVNAVTPTALRFAPSLLVTDDEIAAAVAILTQVLDATGGPA